MVYYLVESGENIMGNVVHAIDIKKVITSSLIGILLGTLLILVPASALAGIIITIIAVMMIGVNGYKLYVDMSEKKETSNATLLYVLGVLAGFILLCFSNIVINILVSIYLVVIPLISIIKSKGDKKVLLDNSPRIILGLVLLVSGIAVFDVIFMIVGILVLILSLGYLGINYYLYRKSGVKIIK